MKRRRFVQTMMAAPAAPTLLAQQGLAPGGPGPGGFGPGGGMRPNGPVEAVKLETGVADDGGETVLHFFNPAQLTALRKLGDVILPSINGAPGASETRAAEFLDFLVGQSLSEKQTLYRNGLDHLNKESAKKFSKP